MDFGPKVGAVTVNYRGGPVKVTLKTGDTVSYVCGSVVDGHDYCGPRTIKFYSMPSGMEATSANFLFFAFDAIANQVTFQSTKFEEVGSYEFEVRATLVNNGVSQEYVMETIPVTVFDTCTLAQLVASYESVEITTLGGDGIAEYATLELP